MWYRSIGLGPSSSKEFERIIDRVVKNLQVADSLSNIIDGAITLLSLLHYKHRSLEATTAKKR